MKLTNRHGLPDSIYEAALNDAYDPGESDITVTGLISPPMQKALLLKHDSEIVDDVANRLWSLFGQGMHAVLERSEPSAIVEQRLYTTVNRWKVGGQFDRLMLKEGILQDYKVTSVWEVINGLKPEREQQLNLLAELATRNGLRINKLEVVFLCRDWQMSKAEFDASYPQVPMVVLPVPLWKREDTVAYLNRRVSLHQAARNGIYEICTDKERWYTGTSWAVMKKGAKRALRVLESEQEAQKYLGNHKDKDVLFIEERPGEYKRCKNYCLAKNWCPVYAEKKDENLASSKESP